MAVVMRQKVPGRRPRLPVLLLAVLPVFMVGCGTDRRADDGLPGPTTTGPTTTGPITDPTTTGPDTTPGARTEPGVVPEPTSEVRTLAFGGRERTYRLHVPAGLPAGEPVALVVGLHGGLGSARQFAATSGLEEAADERGFITAIPDGAGRPPGDRPRTWNGGYCCGYAQTSGIDDVGFLEAVVEQVAAEYPVDPTRVGVMGHSNGAIMAYRLACEASTSFTAVVAVAGSLGVDDCDPDHAVAVLHIHGAADQNHPVEGGVGPKSVIPGAFAFRPAADAVETWADLDGCGPAPTRTEDGALTTTRWGGCAAGTEVVFTVIAGASHAWPGSDPNPLTEARTGPPTQDLDATEEAVTFLLAHPRALGPGR